MTQDELVENLSIEFDEVYDLFNCDSGESVDDYNQERDDFIRWGITLINTCIKGREHD